MVHIFSVEDVIYIFNMFILSVISIFAILKLHIIGIIIAFMIVPCILFSIAEYIKNMITIYKQVYRNKRD